MLLVILLLLLLQVVLLQYVLIVLLKVELGVVNGLVGLLLLWVLLLLLVWVLGMGICLLCDLCVQCCFEWCMGLLKLCVDGSWQVSGDLGLLVLVGLWWLCIVVGLDFDQQFIVQEQSLILQYECSYYCYGDYWVNGVLLLVCVVFWFYLFQLWVVGCFLCDQELVCDVCIMVLQLMLCGFYVSMLLKVQLVYLVVFVVCYWCS